MEDKINDYIKSALDLKATITLMNRNMSIFNEQEDSFVLTTLRSLPTNEELDTFIFYLKEKINRITSTRLYCIEIDLTSDTGYTVNEIKVLKDTGKLLKISSHGYSQLNKAVDLNVPKIADDEIIVFTTDVEKGIKVIKESINNRIDDMKKDIENYNQILKKIKEA